MGIEIMATLPRDSSIKHLRECFEVAKSVRLHTGKMLPEEASKLKRKTRDIGYSETTDSRGRVTSIKLSPGMRPEIPGDPNTNYLMDLREDERVGLISHENAYNDLELSENVGEKKVIYATFLPNEVEVGDEVNFDNGHITGSVAGKTKYGLIIRLAEVNTSLYWNTKFALKDAVRSHSGPRVLTLYDLNYLRALDYQPDEVALSFVNSGQEVKDATDDLEQLGWDMAKVRINSKLETLHAISEIQSIAGTSDVITLARGDMNLAADLEVATNKIISVLPSLVNRWGIPIQLDIASNLAESLRVKARNNLPIDRLSQDEREVLSTFVRLESIRRFWLAGETMVTGSLAVPILKTFKSEVDFLLR